MLRTVLKQHLICAENFENNHMARRTSGFNNIRFRQMYLAFVLITGPTEPVTIVMGRGKH